MRGVHFAILQISYRILDGDTASTAERTAGPRPTADPPHSPSPTPCARETEMGPTNIVNLRLLKVHTTLLDIASLSTFLGILVDLEIALELSIRFQIPGLVRSVFVNHIGAVVLEVAQGDEDDVAYYNPYLFPVSAGRQEKREGGGVTRLFPHLTSDLA